MMNVFARPRIVTGAVVGIIVGSALYLWVVRGLAISLDLALLSDFLICF